LLYYELYYTVYTAWKSQWEQIHFMLKSFCNTNIICLKTFVSGIFDIYIRREFFQNLIRHLEDIGYELDFVQKSYPTLTITFSLNCKTHFVHFTKYPNSNKIVIVDVENSTIYWCAYEGNIY